MKRIYILFLFCFPFFLTAQSPLRINYQGVARNSKGSPLPGKTMTIRFELLQNTTTVFSEDQTIITNPLGLFSTQIGKVNETAIAAIDWEAGPIFLNIQLDTTTTGNFFDLGKQELTSSPYALHARSVPSTYSNNILTIGSKTHTLGSAAATMSLEAGTNVEVTGTTPNFTINATPSLSLLGPGTLSISGGNSVSIVPGLSLVGEHLSVGASSNTVNIAPVLTGSGAVNVSGSFPNYTLYAPGSSSINGSGLASISSTAANHYLVDVPSASLNVSGYTLSLTQGASSSSVLLPAPNSTTLSATGVASVSTSVPNSFSIDVPAPVLTVSGNSISVTQGSAVSTATIASALNTAISGSGILTVNTTGTNTYVLGVPAPSLSATSNTISITQGTAQSSVTVPIVPTTSLSSGGLVNISSTGTNSFVVSVPAPSLNATNNTISITQGTAQSSVTVPIVPTTSLSSGGLVNISSTGTNSFVLSVPAPSISISGSSVSVSQGTAVSTATIASTPNTSLSGTGILTVTSTGNNTFALGVPAPSLSANSNTISITQGTALSSVTVPIVPTTSLSSGGIVNISNIGTNSFVLSVPAPSISISGSSVSVSQGTAVSTATIASTPNTSLSGTGILTVTSTGNNTFALGVPAPSLSANSNTISITQGTAVSTVTVPVVRNTSLTTSGVLNISSSGTNTFALSVPAPSLSISGNSISITQGTALSTVAYATTSLTISNNPAGAASISGISPSYTLNVPTPAISASGLATVTNTLNAFTISVPTLSYNTASGQLVSGSNSVNITPNLSLNGNTLVLGPSSNSISLSSILPFSTTPSGQIIQTNPSHLVGIGTTNPTSKLEVTENGNYTGSFLKVTNTNANNTNYTGEFSSNGLGTTMYVNNTNSFAGSFAGIFDGGLFVRGKSNLSSAFAFTSTDNSNNPLLAVRNDGFVGIGTISPSAILTVVNNASGSTALLVESTSSSTNTHTAIFKQYGSGNAGHFECGNGNSGHAVYASSAGNTQHTLRSINTGGSPNIYAGYFEGGLVSKGKNAGFVFRALNNNSTDVFVVKTSGQVGVGNATPSATLDVQGTVKINDGTQGADKVLTSDANGLASWQTMLAPGIVMAFAGSTANIPSGWVLCDGSQVSRTGTTANLFAAIGTAWGVGNGTTTFNLPDMRGMFLRGVDPTAQNDQDAYLRVSTNNGNSGNQVGSYQADENKAHVHNFPSPNGASNGPALYGTSSSLVSGVNTTAPSGGTESRPKNVYVYYIIKL